MKDTRNTGKNPQSLAERVHRMTKELHLPGFRQRMEETLEDATWQQMTSLEQIYDLLNAEIVRREANTAVKLRRHSNLPLDLINARFEELYESDNRRWDTRLMALVRDGQWMLRETPADLITSFVLEGSLWILRSIESITRWKNARQNSKESIYSFLMTF